MTPPPGHEKVCPDHIKYGRPCRPCREWAKAVAVEARKNLNTLACKRESSQVSIFDQPKGAQ